MATAYNTNAVDFDDLFMPLGVATPGPDCGRKIAGVDLSQRYHPSTGPGDRIGVDTGYKVAGADLRTVFRDINYIPPPVIVTHPVSQTVLVGDDVTFTVVVSGPGPFDYQWVKNTDGNAVPGATSDTLTLFGVDLSDSGSYACFVENAGGQVRSNYASLTINSPPVITGNPNNVSLCTLGGGSWVTFDLTVGAAGSGLSYQWRKGGVNISGATSSTLSFSTGFPSDSGSYDCVVTNAYGSVTSASATVAINDPVSITGGTITGGPYTLNAGDVVNFTVTAIGTNLSYLWKKDGTPTGHTGSSIPPFIAAVGDSGTWSVEVSNPCGTESESSSLTVNP